ncbi:hypothetical protein NSPZN2_60066 [Nitrospira defluvii]|uniref:Uncharacterized protein n=1 Tax=Nitrospira defluvii TaxID=330214 RepID=A0ABM8S713_9BACT|nr:hypothetical protein NSPZN2_60066 [Nitrospira defluvii]
MPPLFPHRTEARRTGIVRLAPALAAAAADGLFEHPASGDTIVSLSTHTFHTFIWPRRAAVSPAARSQSGRPSAGA